MQFGKLKKRIYFAVEVVGKEISHSFGRYLDIWRKKDISITHPLVPRLKEIGAHLVEGNSVQKY